MEPRGRPPSNGPYVPPVDQYFQFGYWLSLIRRVALKHVFALALVAALTINCSSGSGDDDSNGASPMHYVCTVSPNPSSDQELSCELCVDTSCCDELGACKASAGCLACLNNPSQSCTGSGTDLYASYLGCGLAHCATQCNAPTTPETVSCTNDLVCPSEDDCCILQPDGSGVCGKTTDAIGGHCLCQSGPMLYTLCGLVRVLGLARLLGALRHRWQPASG
jgi:hypothetical protein